MLKNLYRSLASLKLAVFCLLGLSAVLAIGTVLESIYGTRAAQTMVYSTVWFGGLLFLLGMNVLCAALIRFPWKKHQTGFVITHTGILIILFGSFLTQKLGVDGSLPVTENSANEVVILNDMFLTVKEEDSEHEIKIPIQEYGRIKSKDLLRVQVAPENYIVVDNFLPRVRPETKIVKSPLEGLGKPALKLHLFNNRMNIEEWLLQENPDKPAELSLGPAVLSFRKLWTSEEERKFLETEDLPDKSPKDFPGVLELALGGKEIRLPVIPNVSSWQRVGAFNFELRILKYLPYAIVQGNELVNKSNDPVNPTVQLEIRSPAGKTEMHTVFAQFPEFPTLHRKRGPSSYPDLKLKFILQAPKSNEPAPRGRLLLAQSVDNKTLFYRVHGTGGKLNAKGKVDPGKIEKTGWMDFQFEVSEWIPDAVKKMEPYYIDRISTTEANFLSAIHVTHRSPRKPSNETAGEWLIEDFPASLVVGDKRYFLRYSREELKLPFSIFLDKFHIGHDPGTERAASYESRVTVKDSNEGLTKSQLISMNEPMVYAGYTFYQASYQLRDGLPPVSIFSVNWDPGRWVKYIGSIVMILGIAIMFYMNPHYFGVIMHLGRKTK